MGCPYCKNCREPVHEMVPKGEWDPGRGLLFGTTIPGKGLLSRTAIEDTFELTSREFYSAVREGIVTDMGRVSGDPHQARHWYRVHDEGGLWDVHDKFRPKNQERAAGADVSRLAGLMWLLLYGASLSIGQIHAMRLELGISKMGMSRAIRTAREWEKERMGGSQYDHWRYDDWLAQQNTIGHHIQQVEP